MGIAQSDDCMLAPELIVVDDCIRSPGNTKGLRENAKTNTCGGNPDDDGWFKFRAISERTQISVSTDQLTDMVIGVFQNCAIELGCINGKGNGGQEILRLDTKIGDVYFIQVYEAGDGGAEFLICVSALDPIICTEPTAINFNLTPPNCMDAASASIEIRAIEGGTPPFSYQINNGDFQTSPVFSNLTANQYQIVLQDSLECQFDTILNIIDTNDLVLEIGEDLVVKQGELVSLQANTNSSTNQIESITWEGIEEYNCNSSCKIIDFIANNSTIIQVILTSIDGCQLIDELHLTVQSEAKLFIPNVFSPNGDGVNDLFTVATNVGITRLVEVTIVNRSGGLVFQRYNVLPNSADSNWDGQLKNEDLPSDVYIYVISYESQDKQITTISGTVTLIR